MHYRLRDNLSYCLIDGHAVFLDIDADRYFLLSGHLERTFLAYASRNSLADETLKELADRKILAPCPADASIEPAFNDSLPTRSAIELSRPTGRFAARHVAEVWRDVWISRRLLKVRTLKNVVDATARYRNERVEPPVPRCAPPPQKHLLEHANIFRRARLYIPIEPRCLPDSLALIRFLARRQRYGSIIFGVTYEPFSAHCWVQTGNLILNDTLGNATSHTPIRVV